MNGSVYVAWAKQDAKKHDDAAGIGNGYVASFDMSGNLLSSLVSQGPLNSPWGLAIAPSTYGPFGSSLLVGNFGDGMVNAFALSGGKLLGTLSDLKGSPISIPGLWSLNFGSGARSEDQGRSTSRRESAEARTTIQWSRMVLLGSIRPCRRLRIRGYRVLPVFSQPHRPE